MAVMTTVANFFIANFDPLHPQRGNCRCSSWPKVSITFAVVLKSTKCTQNRIHRTIIKTWRRFFSPQSLIRERGHCGRRVFVQILCPFIIIKLSLSKHHLTIILFVLYHKTCHCLCFWKCIGLHFLCRIYESLKVLSEFSA